jgi:hypothetical protein
MTFLNEASDLPEYILGFFGVFVCLLACFFSGVWGLEQRRAVESQEMQVPVPAALLPVWLDTGTLL